MSPEELFDDVKPFSGELPAPLPQEQGGALVEAAVQREIAEVQAAMTIAKKFPRNQKQAFERIMLACQRPTLAEEALYSYSRGGTEITGPSIRLAEAIIQQWGNADFGIKEVDQRNGESTVMAYAWDLETNTRQTKTFQVKHKRYTKKGSYNLEDPRDIYEMVANLGARRLRACILGVIPGDIVAAAQAECEKTLRIKADNSPEAVKRMVEKFAEHGVSKAMIEKRIQRNLESITPAQMVSMRKIFNSLKDGMSKPEDWFEVVAEPMVAAPAQSQEKKERNKPRQDKAEKPQDAPGQTIELKPDEFTPRLANNGSQTATGPGKVLLDADSLEEIRIYCRKLGLDPDREAAKYSETKTPKLSMLTHAEGGKMLGVLMDLAAEKGLV